MFLLGFGVGFCVCLLACWLGWVGILWLLGFVVVGWLGWVLVCFLSCPHQDKPVITKLILKLLCPSAGFVEEEEASGDARRLHDEHLTGFHP